MLARPALISLSCALLGMTVLASLSACTDPPDLPDRPKDELTGAPYPPLVPLEGLLISEPPDPEDDARTTETLEARIANLQARATRLQGSSAIDNETRSRLNRQIPTD